MGESSIASSISLSAIFFLHHLTNIFQLFHARSQSGTIKSRAEWSPGHLAAVLCRFVFKFLLL